MFMGDKCLFFISGHTADRIYIGFSLFMMTVCVLLCWSFHWISPLGRAVLLKNPWYGKRDA